MYEHYEGKTVSSDELDRLIDRAEAEERKAGSWAQTQVTDEIDCDGDDAAVDSFLFHRLDALGFPNENEPSRPNVGADDVFAARDALGLKLATIYRAAGRGERVVVINGQAETDALVWALVSSLPTWITSRYRDLIAAHPGAKLLIF